MSQLDFTIKNKYSDVIIQCPDNTLYCSKFILSNNTYFERIFDDNVSELTTDYNSEIMNILLNVISNNNMQTYLTIENVAILYEATYHYNMFEQNSEIRDYIINNVRDINFNSSFIMVIYSFRDTAIIKKINEITTVRNTGLSLIYTGNNIELNIDEHCFLYLTTNYKTMNDNFYVYLITKWINDYVCISEYKIMYVLDKHIDKIMKLELINSFDYLYNYLDRNIQSRIPIEYLENKVFKIIYNELKDMNFEYSK
jgi:hypothetical protein